MAYKIVSTLRFDASVQKTSEWLQHVWSLQSVEKFHQRLKLVITQVSNNPKIGRPAAKTNVRSVWVTKHNRMYYRVKDNVITLLLLFETKQHPNKNKYE